MLAVVHHEQHIPSDQRIEEAVLDGGPWELAHPYGGRHGEDHTARVGDMRQLAQPGSISTVTGYDVSSLDGKPRFADTAGSRERHQPRAPEGGNYCGDRLVPPDETAGGHRQRVTVPPPETSGG